MTAKSGTLRSWSRRWLMVLGLLGSSWASSASADVGATGLITTLCVPTQCCGQIQFDDQTYSVFGNDYNIVQSGVAAVGSVDTSIVLAQQGSFDGSWTQVPSGAFTFGASGSFLCADPGGFCMGAPVSFVGNLSNPTFPPVLAQHDWTFDGTVSYTSAPVGTVPASCPIAFGLFYEGLVAFNAFLDGQPTPTGSDVSLVIPVSYFDTLVGQTVEHAVQITYGTVTQAGTTSATAFTSAPGQVPPGFKVRVGPFNGGYVDVTTDAVYAPPIQMCITLDPDWLALLHQVGFDLNDVRLFHDEGGGVYDDPPTSNNGTDTVCATVDHLSFFALGVATCPDTPMTGCRQGAKSSLLLKDSANDATDKLIWKLVKGDETSQTEFADPSAGDDYALCLYAGSPATLIDQAVVNADPSKWSALGTVGYKYTDATGAADGVFVGKLKGGDAGKTKTLVKGKGEHLRDLAPGTLPIPSAGFPLRAQLSKAGSGLCWESSYVETDVKKNAEDQFKASSMVP